LSISATLKKAVCGSRSRDARKSLKISIGEERKGRNDSPKAYIPTTDQPHRKMSKKEALRFTAGEYLIKLQKAGTVGGVFGSGMDNSSQLD